MSNHDKIRTLLSAYCGDDLEPAERHRVEEHLAMCNECQAELSDLQTALRLIRTTPDVEPPPWLATRIMARVREQQQEKRSWLQRLFLPLRIKLPIEIAALLLVCVSGYYMARTVETELKQPVGREETVSAPLQSGTQNEARKATPPPAAIAPPQPPAAQKKRIVDPQTPAPVQPSGPKAAEQAAPPLRPEYPGAPSRVMKEERFVTSPEPMPESMSSNQTVLSGSSGNHAKKAKKASPSLEAERRDSTNSESVTRAAGATHDLSIPVVNIRMSFADPAEAPTTLRELVIRCGGSLDDERILRPNTLMARLPSPRLQELLTRLERVGSIIKHPQPTDSTGIIKIEISW